MIHPHKAWVTYIYMGKSADSTSQKIRTFDLEYQDFNDHEKDVNDWFKDISVDVPWVHRGEFKIINCSDVPAKYQPPVGIVDPEFFEFKKHLDKTHLSYDVFRAGIDAGLKPSEIEDQFIGRFPRAEDYAKFYYEQVKGMPINELPYKYVDWTKVFEEMNVTARSYAGYWFTNPPSNETLTVYKRGDFQQLDPYDGRSK